jgi:hypothetical protein
VRVRFPRIAFLFACAVSLALPLAAQSPNGSINGRVVDPSNGVIIGADILVVNDATGVTYSGKTNDDGIYVVPNLPPGPYRLQVSKVGFKTLIKPDIVLNVQDALSINFTLPVGAIFETITVEGGAPLVNTESAAVSTVVDRKYVENMPLNGRSFQDLILLVPGVVTNNPQGGGVSIGETGEFSVNGQRTESNYYTVDGVSANVGITPVATAGSGGISGSLPASTALGTTQGLVSVDALEEFRVDTSSYSAELGRNPGAQFSFVTRSGTNQWHGTGYDYLRNNDFDANDWFNDYFQQAQPPLRQNDFGVTLGGPVEIPHIYHGRDRTFFFFSYEGLRLDQPQAANVTYVPDADLRSNTPPPLQQVLNAFPLANSTDLGNGLAEFIGTWSNPSHIDATSVRFDHVVGKRLRMFFRFAQTSSGVVARGTGLVGVASLLNSSDFTTRTYTLGATSSFSTNVSNEFRLNYTSNVGLSSATPSNFGGALPVNLFQLQGVAGGTQVSPDIEIGLFLGGGYPTIIQSANTGKQMQWNLVDTISLTSGRHQFKFGFDFRRLEPKIYAGSPVAIYRYFSAGSVETNSVDIGFGESNAPAFPLYTNLSVFTQDEWKLSARLNLSMGLRWEVNPAPGAADGNLPYTVTGNSLATLALAPRDTPLWKTTWFNFAPRLGAAYVLRSSPAWEAVARAGGGVFFDTGQQVGSYGYQGLGFSAMTPFFGQLVGVPASFPLPATQVSPPIVSPPVAPYTNSTVYAFSPHLQLPYTLHWNASFQQALGKPQALTVSYVGAHAARLLQQKEVNVQPFNPNFGNVSFFQNGLTSDYDAFQMQFQRRLSSGLQVLASYTWAHAIDYGSYNFFVPYERGNSDFDIRHNFTAAVTYDLPNFSRGDVARFVLSRWGLDGRFMARTGFPVTLNGNLLTDPATGQVSYSGLDTVPGQSVYIYGSQCNAVYSNGLPNVLPCPGGRAISPNAFTLPAGDTAGDAPRNFVRGFGAWQMDLALRREFSIYDRLKLQFRTEAFNVFNHPNFGTINPDYCSPSAGTGCTFGQPQATLANSLGGLSSIYQMGGPRSMQLALKLIF